MSFFDSYSVSTSGMSAQRTRINIVSSNIANAQTTHSKDGGPYKKQNVIFEEVLLQTQQKQDTNAIDKTPKQETPLIGVKVSKISTSKDKPILKYDPTHPDANKDGYVAYPNINPVIEMTDLIEALRSYEANLSAFTTQKDMDTKTIDILKV
jgi:flagellar basal-body rod protein FlgC